VRARQQVFDSLSLDPSSVECLNAFRFQRVGIEHEEWVFRAGLADRVFECEEAREVFGVGEKRGID
jgi:hypothetical protein